MFGNIKNALKMRQQFNDMQKKLKAMKVTGQSKGGLVKMHANGLSEIESIELSDDFSTKGKEEMQKLIRDAANDLQEELKKAMQSEAPSMTDMLGMLGGGE